VAERDDDVFVEIDDDDAPVGAKKETADFDTDLKEDSKEEQAAEERTSKVHVVEKPEADDERLDLESRADESADREEDEAADPDESEDDGEDRLERNRENRRKKKLARQRDRAERDQLLRQNAVIQEQLEGQRQETLALRVDNLNAKIRESVAVARNAESVMAQAKEAKDGIAFTEAKDIRDNAIREGNQALAHREQLTGPTRQADPARKPGTQQVDPRILDHGKKFKADHQWFNWDGSDQDSAIVYAIDATIKREGFDPNTEDYWDELRDRVRSALPQKFAKGGRVTTTESKPRADTQSPVSGGRKDGASPRSARESNTLRFSQAERETLEEAGYWGDPGKMKAMRKRWDAQRRSGSRAAR
jgi:hypothetical protein